MDTKKSAVKDGTHKANREWRIEEFVSSLSAELDRAQDLLAMKQSSRALTYALKDVRLRLAVHVRYTEDGQARYRTSAPGDETSSHLELELCPTPGAATAEPVPRTEPARDPPWPISSLTGIADEEIRSLEALSIQTLADLRQAAATPGQLRRVVRVSGVREARLRRWLSLPLLVDLRPVEKPPGAVEIRGENLGEAPGEGARILFGRAEGEIVSWSPSGLIALPPAGEKAEAILIMLDGAPTNIIRWPSEPAKPKLRLEVVSLAASPERATTEDTLDLTARVKNTGEIVTEEIPFSWRVGDDEIASSSIGSLAPGKEVRPSLNRRFGKGEHTVTFALDPHRKLPWLDPEKTLRSIKVFITDAASHSKAFSFVLRVERLIQDKHGHLEAAIVAGTFVNRTGRTISPLPLEISFDSTCFKHRSSQPKPDRAVRGAKRTKLSWENLGALHNATTRTVLITLDALSLSKICRSTVHGGTGEDHDLPRESTLMLTVPPRLNELTDIGPARVRLLQEIGIFTVKALAEANAELVARVIKLSLEKTKRLLRAARKALETN